MPDRTQLLRVEKRQTVAEPQLALLLGRAMHPEAASRGHDTLRVFIIDGLEGPPPAHMVAMEAGTLSRSRSPQVHDGHLLGRSHRRRLVDGSHRLRHVPVRRRARQQSDTGAVVPGRLASVTLNGAARDASSRVNPVFVDSSLTVVIDAVSMSATPGTGAAVRPHGQRFPSLSRYRRRCPIGRRIPIRLDHEVMEPCRYAS